MPHGAPPEHFRPQVMENDPTSFTLGQSGVGILGPLEEQLKQYTTVIQGLKYPKGAMTHEAIISCLSGVSAPDGVSLPDDSVSRVTLEHQIAAGLGVKPLILGACAHRSFGLDKDGNPIVRKAKAPPDLSKGTVLGTSKMHKDGEIVETKDAYYVRRPDQDNRIVFTLKKELCGKQLPAEEVRKLFETGRTDLIPGFMSKRGMPFGAYLVLSKTGAKAEFEFPPR